MKTDIKLKNMINHMIQLRVYDDDMSIVMRLRMIEELNMQIKNILVHRHAENQTQAVPEEQSTNKDLTENQK